MQELGTFAVAANLKWLLAAVLAALALWLGQSAWRGASEAIAQRGWTVLPAVDTALREAGSAEYELAPDVAAAIPGLRALPEAQPWEPGHVRVRVPLDPRLPPHPGVTDHLLQDPADPARVVVPNPWWPWARVLAEAAAVLALLAALRLLLQADWGADLAWSAGGWTPAEGAGTPPGLRADPSTLLREPRGTAITAAALTLVFVGLLVAGLATMPRPAPWFWPLPVLLLAPLAALGLHATVVAQTTRVGADAAGIVSASFFGARRVPWSAIASAERRNTRLDEQKAWDSRSIADRKGKRPKSAFVFEFRDAAGQVLLALPETLEPAAGLDALLERAARAAGSEPAPLLDRERLDTPYAWNAPRPSEGAATVTDDEADEADDEADDEAMDAAMAASQAEFEAFARESNRTMRRGWLLVVAPFALLALWLTWRAAWFQFLAERAEGRVVAWEGTELRSLTVEFRDADGKTHRLTSDGTRGYARFGTDDRLRVFYEAAEPANARLDLFLEIWLWPMVWGVITGLVALPLLFMR